MGPSISHQKSFLNRKIGTSKQEHPEPRLRNFRKRFKFCWLVLCLTGLSYHLYDTTNKFLKYPTNSQVSIAREKDILPPALSVCFNYHEILDPSALDDRTRESLNIYQCFKFKSYTLLPLCNRILGNITFSEMLQNKTVNITDIIWKVDERATEYFRLRTKCIKIVLFKDTSRRQSLSRMDYMAGLSPIILKVFFDVTFRTFPKLHALIGVHNADRLFRLRDGNAFLVTAEEHVVNVFHIDHQLIESRYLQYPFESNCVDYNGSEFESQNHCFEVCYGGPEGKSNGQNGLITTANYSLLNYSMAYRWAVNEKVEKECYEKCPTECMQKEYYASVQTKFAVEGLENKMGFYLYSSHPSVTVIMVQSFDLHSFIIYFASVISLWFGCSIFHTIFGSLNISIKTN